MRWKLKLIRRRLFSRATQRVQVRGALTWPLRWLAAALVLGLSGALALAAFEWGKDFAGLDRSARQQAAQLQDEVATLRAELARVERVANTAESLLKTGEATQSRLAEQLKQVEAENLVIKADLAVFERFLPKADSQAGVAIARFDVSVQAPGRVRYQALVVMGGQSRQAFSGRYELTLTGTLLGKPWTAALPAGDHVLELTQYRRVEGSLEYDANAMVQTAQLRVLDAQGTLRATEQARL